MSAAEDFIEMDERAADLVENREKMLFELVQARKSQGLTLEVVAERMSVSVESLVEFERYDSSPLLSTVVHYAHAVNCMLSYVVSLRKETK